MTATHIINLLPSAVLQWDTPYHKIHGTKSTYDQLRIIGCQCFALRRGADKDEIASNAQKCAFKLLDWKSLKVFVSRDSDLVELPITYLSMVSPVSDESKKTNSRHILSPSSDSPTIDLEIVIVDVDSVDDPLLMKPNEVMHVPEFVKDHNIKDLGLVRLAIRISCTQINF
ncbi:hypothetical protein V2J09_013003 [Rumex salicifolius]